MNKRMAAAVLLLGLMAGCAPAAESPAASSSPQEDSVTYEEVTLYLPGEDAESLIEQEVQVEQTGEPIVEMVDALVSAGALPEGTEVQDWSSSTDTPPKVKVDLNSAFAEGILNQGTAGETMILASLVNTIWAYYAPSELTITADGRPVETGHNVYDTPFTGPMELA